MNAAHGAYIEAETDALGKFCRSKRSKFLSRDSPEIM